MTEHVTEEELISLVTNVLANAGVRRATARTLAQSITCAERDGTFSHGLMRLQGYLDTLSSGWVDGQASFTILDQAPGAVLADANNGFAQGALAEARPLLIEKARQNGIATLAIRNSHHFGCLWADVEPFAEEGLVALAFVNSRSRIVAPGAKKKVLGTNPMAFAAPRAEGGPLVWDQASSVMAHGDVIIAASNGQKLRPDCGVDIDGNPTTNPEDVLAGGALLPFAGHKGLLIAMLVETLAAACTGSRFGFEDESPKFSGAQTSNAGEFLIVIDPIRLGATAFHERIEQFLQALITGGTTRLPGQKRFAQRARAREKGIPIRPEYMRLLFHRPLEQWPECP